MGEIAKTVLYERHVLAGGKMVDFAGYLMPVQYGDGIVAEHLLTRKKAGIFDVSHMGRFVFRGGGTLAFLQYLLTNNAGKLAVGDSQYTIIANENGGAIDDAYLYRFREGEYLLVVNAANREKDAIHVRQELEKFEDVEIVDVSEELAMISLQGPDSAKILAEVLENGDLPAEKRNCLSIVEICGVEVLVGRTGYAGEGVCFELMFASAAAVRVWDCLVGKGAGPVGLGARDTLRLEAGLPLYGHEYGIDIEGREIPVFACPLAKFGVSFAADKGDFVGKSALGKQAEALENGDENVLPRRIRQIAFLGRGIARAGAKVYFEGKNAGFVTSGTMVPYWKSEEESGMRALAMGLLNCNIRVGDAIEIDIRGKAIAAKVVARNLQSRGGEASIPMVFEG